MILRQLIPAVVMALSAFTVYGVTTNDAATALLEGRQLARQLREIRPTQSFTNTATLKLRGAKARRADLPLQIITSLALTNWQVAYRTAVTNPAVVAAFTVAHDEHGSNEYRSISVDGSESCVALAAGQLWTSFAGSDFTLVDLGQEFFHWPEQKLLKKELKKGQSCDVLESRPASALANGYARVVSWIDRDTGGIVQAEAYDAKGKLLKEFELKEASKVNGEWRVTEIEMHNVQTGSRTLLVFDYGH